MVVGSARRTGRFGAFGRYLLPYSMFLLEKITLKFALNVACRSSVPRAFLNTLDVLGYERLGNTH